MQCCTDNDSPYETRKSVVRKKRDCAKHNAEVVDDWRNRVERVAMFVLGDRGRDVGKAEEDCLQKKDARQVGEFSEIFRGECGEKLQEQQEANTPRQPYLNIVSALLHRVARFPE